MIAKIKFFFEVLLIPLSWMPDICQQLITSVAYALSLFILAFFISKVVNFFK